MPYEPEQSADVARALQDDLLLHDLDVKGAVAILSLDLDACGPGSRHGDHRQRISNLTVVC